MSDRVRFTLFGKQKCQCPVATIGKFPLLLSRQSGYIHDQSLPMSAKCVQLVETTTKSVYIGGGGGGGGGPANCMPP